MHQLYYATSLTMIDIACVHTIPWLVFIKSIGANWKWCKRPWFLINIVYIVMRESFTIILFMTMFTFETLFGLGQKMNKHTWEIYSIVDIVQMQWLKNLNSQMPAMRVMLVMVQILYGIPMHNTTKCFYNYPINLPSNLFCFQLAFW